MGKIKIGNGQSQFAQLPKPPAPSLDELLTMPFSPIPDIILNEPIKVCQCEDEISHIKLDIELLKRVEPIIIDKNTPVVMCPVMIDSRVRKYTKALRHEFLTFQEDAVSTLKLVSLKLEKIDNRIKELENKKLEIQTQDYHHTETIKEIPYKLDNRAILVMTGLAIMNVILIITLINK